MNISEIKEKITQNGFEDDFRLLYGETSGAVRRYAAACDSFVKLYGEREDIRLFSAPGRTEIGGNHTDHQHGCVLAGSVDLDVIAVVSLNNSRIVRIKSEGYPMDEVNLDELNINKSEYGHASALIRGVCAALRNNGYEIGGFDAYTTSNVLKGSGLSSSAAFEVLVANILNGLFNSNRVDAVSIAKYAQFAEREYFGKPCGLLDQMASSVGGFTYADFNDPSDPLIEKIQLDLNRFGHVLCVVDTGGNHADLTQDYADITLECRAVSEALGVEFLRDADEEKFRSQIAVVRGRCGDRAVLRAIHFFQEQRRVERQRAALKSGDFEEFLRLVNASGESSYKFLQNLYSPSNSAQQGLSLAIALTQEYLNGQGACRVHGGGFAGTIQCYVPASMLDGYRAMIESAFGEGSCVALNIRPVGGYELK